LHHAVSTHRLPAGVGAGIRIDLVAVIANLALLQDTVSACGTTAEIAADVIIDFVSVIAFLSRLDKAIATTS